MRGKDAQAALQPFDVAVAGARQHQPEPVAIAAIKQHADEPVDAIGFQEVTEKLAFIEFLARHDVEAVDDAAVAVTLELARPGVMAGVNRGVDFLDARREAGRGDETRARRVAVFPQDESRVPVQRAERAGDAGEGLVPAFGMQDRIVYFADQRVEHLPFGRRIMVGRKGRSLIALHVLLPTEDTQPPHLRRAEPRWQAQCDKMKKIRSLPRWVAKRSRESAMKDPRPEEGGTKAILLS